MAMAGIYSATFGVFFKPISEQFDWSRATMSGAYSVRALISAALTIPVGYWADRYGPRRILLPCIALLGICLIAAAKISSIWQLYLILGVGVGIATSGPFVCIIATAAKWHNKRRGLALGIAAAGAGLSSIIFPPIAENLIEATGWATAIFLFGLMTLLIGIPITLVMKDPPTEAIKQSVGRSNVHRNLFGSWRKQIQFLKNRVLIAIMIMFLFLYAAGHMMSSHLVNYATDIGIVALTAAGMMSVTGIASTAGRLVMGGISDRIGTRADAVVCYILQSASFLLLATQVPELMWVAAVMFGIGSGGSVPLIPAIMGEWVSRDNLATMVGVGTMAGSIGAALGPWLGGLIFDVSGNYLWALLMGTGFGIVALVIMLMLPSTQRGVREQGSSILEE